MLILFSFFGFLTLRIVTAQTVTLPSCPNSNYVREPIGCYNTQIDLVAPITTLVYDFGYASNETQQKYCGLKCLSIGTAYFILYNTTGCACVNVQGSLTLTKSSNCTPGKACPNDTFDGTKYCGTTTPEIGAYWFCTPQSACDSATAPASGPHITDSCCWFPHFGNYLEGDYLQRVCYGTGYCLQASTYFRCVNASWVSVGQTENAVCLPCTQSPSVCDIGGACSPKLPPMGVCVNSSSSTTTTASITPVITSSNTQVNQPWFGGNGLPLSSNQMYVLMNATNYTSTDRPLNKTAPENPISVSIAVIVQDIDSVSELTSSFNADLFFYLSWIDPRLNWDNLSIVGLPGSFFQLTTDKEQSLIWAPPIYIGNSRSADKPNSAKQSSVVILKSNGEANMMYRSFTTADCKMNLQNYPFDTQICPIYLGIFGFYDQQVQLNWAVPDMFNISNPTESFSLNEKISLTTWSIKNYYTSPAGEPSLKNAVCAKFRTCLVARIVLKRKISFYIIDTFMPTSIVLAGSCLSFWINPENVPARVSMALTLFLTLQAANLNVRSKLPNVTYVKAIDIWLFFAQGCLFCALAEFLLLHSIIHGYVNLKIFRLQKRQDKSSQTTNDDLNATPNDRNSRLRTALKIEKFSRFFFPIVIILFIFIYFCAYLA